MPERDFGHQFLEARAAPVLAGLAEVGVDDADTLRAPAQGAGPLDQRVLVGLALAVVLDLPHGRLAHRDVGQALAMAGGDRVSGGQRHGSPPARPGRRSPAPALPPPAAVPPRTGGAAAPARAPP